MELVLIKDKEPRVSSVSISEGMGIEHRAVVKLVQKYETILLKRGNVAFEMLHLHNKKVGPKFKVAWLNKRQCTFLIMLMKNSEQVVEFKDKLETAFDKQEKLIAQLLNQKTNAQWLEQRQSGKISRRQETDAIQEFVEYAKTQGSTKPDMYYAHFTKATYKALFIVEQEFKALRDILNGQQLQMLAVADITVAKSLKYGMEQKMHYKDIYVLAKERLEQFSEMIGKSIIPQDILAHHAQQYI